MGWAVAHSFLSYVTTLTPLIAFRLVLFVSDFLHLLEFTCGIRLWQKCGAYLLRDLERVMEVVSERLLFVALMCLVEFRLINNAGMLHFFQC